MPLQVVIVGAGICGLVCAISLRKAGYSVTILERSTLGHESSAAIALAANGGKALASLGFSFTRANTVELSAWETVNAATLNRLSLVDQSDNARRYGCPMMSIHRADLQAELLRLLKAVDDVDGHAAKDSASSDTLKTSIVTGARVVSVDAKQGTVMLGDGTKLSADLIVGADGVNSITRRCVLPIEATTEPTKAPITAFRFTLPTSRLKSDPETKDFLEAKASRASIFADLTVPAEHERHIAWYSCRGGSLQNFACLTSLYTPSDTQHSNTASAGADQPCLKRNLMQQFGNFHPSLAKILRMAPEDEVRTWQLTQHSPLASWVYGKVVLVGDAAHPMFPFGGQGSNQAIEDGVALGRCLQGASPAKTLVSESANDTNSLEQRLRVFERVRVKRAARTMILSSVRAGRESEVGTLLKQWEEEGIETPGNFQERVAHDYGFDVLAECERRLEELEAVNQESCINGFAQF